MRMKNLILGIAAALGVASSAPADTIISDTFKAAGGSARPLGAARTEQGNTAWEATPNLMASGGSEGGVTVSDGAYFIGKLPLPRAPFQKLVIEATVRLTKDQGENPWVAIGAGNPGPTNNSWGGGFFLLLHQDGQWGAFFNPDLAKRETISRLDGGRAVDFDAEGTNTLKIEYDRAKNQVSMWVNGAKVIDGAGLGQPGFHPELSYAGFSGSGGQQADATCLQELKIRLKD